MIGNDIIDLQFPDSPAYSHVGHLARVCTEAEVRAVRAARVPARCFAALWSAKEAAYKLLMREGMSRKFVPREFITNPAPGHLKDSRISLVVEYFHLCCHVTVALTENWAHAVATQSEGAAVLWAVRGIQRRCEGHSPASNESAVVRRLGQELLSGCGMEDAVLDFEGRIPIVKRSTGRADAIGISLSHDGAFAAAAISLIPDPSFRLEDPNLRSIYAGTSEAMCFTSTA